VLIFFVFATSYILLRRGFSGIREVELSVFARGIDVLRALLIVGAVRLYLRAKNFTSRASPQREKWLFRFGLGCLFPLMVAAWANTTEFFWVGWPAATIENKMIWIGISILFIFGTTAPFVSGWAWFALNWRVKPGKQSFQIFTSGVWEGLKFLREWVPFVILVSSYSWMGDVIGNPPFDYDLEMQGIDRWLFFGFEPVLFIQRLVHPLLSDWLAISYSFYALAYPICLAAIYGYAGRQALREGVTALSFGLAVAYVCYALVPVKGPALSMKFTAPLDDYIIQPVKEMLMDHTRITYDCFPSFHSCGMLLMTWLCFRHARRVFWLLLPFAVSTPVACVYLRYHYVTDVLSGLILAMTVAPVAVWACQRTPSSVELF
jgi:hypothetical protein